MTPLLRGAHKIKARLELTLDGRRIAVIVGLQLALLGGAFAAGYFLAGGRTPAPAAAPVSFDFRDPLAALDQEVRPVDYTFHQRLTAARKDADPATRFGGNAAASVRGDGVAPVARVREAGSTRLRRSDAMEMRVLEERVHSLAASTARAGSRLSGAPATGEGSGHAAVGADRARAGGTDEELRLAMAAAAASEPLAPASEARPAEAAVPGSARVELSRPKTVPVTAAGAPVLKPAAPKSAAARKGKYTLQVRSFPDREKAEELVEHLRQRGLDAFLSSGELPGRGQWFRVRVGRFASRAEADRYLQRVLVPEKTNAIVMLNR